MNYTDNKQLQAIAEGMTQCGFKVTIHNDKTLIVKTTQGQVLSYQSGLKVAGINIMIELIGYDMFEVSLR